MAHLNMSDPSQQCPSAWREYNIGGIRACGRPTNSTGSCATEYYFISHQYSRVCGRIIGYQIANPDAFAHTHVQIDFEGVNITRGAVLVSLLQTITALVLQVIALILQHLSVKITTVNLAIQQIDPKTIRSSKRSTVGWPAV